MQILDAPSLTSMLETQNLEFEIVRRNVCLGNYLNTAFIPQTCGCDLHTTDEFQWSHKLVVVGSPCILIHLRDMVDGSNVLPTQQQMRNTIKIISIRQSLYHQIRPIRHLPYLVFHYSSSIMWVNSWDLWVLLKSQSLSSVFVVAVNFNNIRTNNECIQDWQDSPGGSWFSILFYGSLSTWKLN